MSLSLKNTDSTQFFKIKPRHAGRPKKNKSGWRKLSGRAGHMRKTPTTVSGSEHLKIYCRVIVTR